MKHFCFVICLGLWLFSALPAMAAPRELWLYYSTNLLPDKNIDQLAKTWKIAADCGYTKILLADSKFARLGVLGENTKHYLANVQRTQRIAAELHLALVPAVFPVGYSNDILGNDPNLAEGLPVRDALFVVHDGKAGVQADPPVHFGKPSWVDKTVVMENSLATVRDNADNARIVWNLKLPQFRCYHVSVAIKTQDYTSRPEIKALADGVDLQPEYLPVKRTQDWTVCHVVFNTLDHENVNIYLGVWGDARGTLQWKNWHIEEAGLCNVLRRPGAPLVVKDDVTGKPFIEGKDFQPVVDPHLGNDPWPGAYNAWHEPPAIVTSLPEGTRLRVSWYHPAIIYDEQVAGCFAEPAFKNLLADQAKRMRELFGPVAFMMSHDEIRVMNWDASCQAEKKTPGQLLADNAKYCTELLTRAGEHTDVYVWSDMFDPFHNAHDKYYLVNGDLAGAWEGLRPGTLIMNWNFDKRDESLKFFADRHHKQVIAGYYDGDLAHVTQWLDSADKVEGVTGIMYTTWQNDYSKIEPFAAMVKNHK